MYFTNNETIVEISDETCYAVFTNTDLTEGRGQEYAFAFTNNLITAERIGAGKYVMGSDCNIKRVTVLIDKTGKKYYPYCYTVSATPEDINKEMEGLKKQAESEIIRRFKKGEDISDRERAELIKILESKVYENS